MSASAALSPRGAPIFRLDSSKQEAAVESARRKIAEVDAQIRGRARRRREGGRPAAGGQKCATADAWTNLNTKEELYRRNPGNVPFREIERLQERIRGQLGAITAATAAKQGAEERISTLLPAEKASAEAALEQAQVELNKTVIRAGVTGRVEQFFLRVGDVVNPLMRPAGILIPEGAGTRALQAGFGQIEAQIMKVGMIAEVTCVSKPFTVIPMVVTAVQDYIAAGQFRGGEQLIDLQQVTKPGTLLIFLEPLYQGGIDDVTPGSSCIANAYSNNHDIIAAKDTGILARHRLARRRCASACTRLNPAASGADPAVPDAGVQRSLTVRNKAGSSHWTLIDAKSVEYADAYNSCRR